MDALVYGSSRNLTCTAKVTGKRLAYTDNKNASCKIEWWLTGVRVHRCEFMNCLHASSEMSCILALGGSYNELNSSGTFTCKASNDNNECTTQKIEIKPLFGKYDIHALTIIKLTVRSFLFPDPEQSVFNAPIETFSSVGLLISSSVT